MSFYYCDINILPVYLILFPSKTVQKKGTDWNSVGFFNIFKAATLPKIKKYIYTQKKHVKTLSRNQVFEIAKFPESYLELVTFASVQC